MKKVISIIIFMFISLLLAGCKNNELIGNWYSEDTSINSYYTFNKDNTGSFNFNDVSSKFTYKINNSEMTLSYENSNIPATFNYEIKDNKLTISSEGYYQIYIKK